MKNNTLLGAHISIAGGFDKSIERAESIGCTTMQIFSKSNRSWFAKKITSEEADKFKNKLSQSSLSKIMVHSSYLINLGASNENTRLKSIQSLKEELKRCDMLGIKYLVLHPGSHVGAGEDAGMQNISMGLDEVLSQSPSNTMILLETAAGQGTNLGYTFEQLKTIYDRSHHKAQLGMCLDTCHIFSAGYDIRDESGYEKTIKEFDNIIGLEKLFAIHINDSKLDLNSKKDRHEKIGLGKIPLNTFKLIMNDFRLKSIPKILETPILSDPLKEYEEEINMLLKEIKE